MADKPQVKVKIIDPNQILFEGAADYVMAPGKKGTLGILPGHTSMFAELVEGDLYLAGEHEQVFQIKSGILKVRSDEVTILIGIDD
jgi:F-type H+-transporting ATPase subunit epsilon